jgi:two-component system response regulator HydG
VVVPKRNSWGAGRKCLVVMPSKGQAASITRILSGVGFATVVASSEDEALAMLEQDTFASAFVSQALGQVATSSIIASSAHQHPEVPTIIVGSSGTVQEAVDAMQQGAADYLVPPLGGEAVLGRLRKLLERAAAPPATPPESVAPMTGLVGSSPAIRRVLTTLEKISRYKTNVLVLGESGTGKEIIARALHARGPRRQHLFVPLNCATLGRELLENELFGHEKGAFTGATERKKGLFELADGGTLFLDEVGEMDPSTQAKLLRVLERNEFRRVGGTEKVKVDLSVIAATNLNVEDAIRARKFREDLYYRLKVVTLRIPPLRERKEDIPALIEAFIADFNWRNGGKIQGISPQALKLIMEYDWPGNVRELKNAVESAAILAAGETIGPEGFAELTPKRSQPQASAPGASPSRPMAASGVVSLPVGTTLAQAEKELIVATLARSQNRREAARTLGLGLRTLYTKLRQYHIRLEPGAETA